MINWKQLEQFGVSRDYLKTVYNKAEQFITKSLPIGKNWWTNQLIFKALDSKGNVTDGSGALGFCEIKNSYFKNGRMAITNGNASRRGETLYPKIV